MSQMVILRLSASTRQGHWGTSTEVVPAQALPGDASCGTWADHLSSCHPQIPRPEYCRQTMPASQVDFLLRSPRALSTASSWRRPRIRR